MTPTPTTIDAYLDGINPDFRPELERIRALVAKLVPEAEESMSYKMPTFKYKTRPLIYFTASKKHMSFYPSSFAIEEFGEELAGYKTTEHAIQFTLKNPLPEDLIEKMTLFHKRKIDEDDQ